MNRRLFPRRAARAILLALVFASAGGVLRAAKPTYPPAKKGAIVQDYGAVKVADPYRWLENADDPETAAWVEAENALTRSFLDGPRARGDQDSASTELFDYPRVSVPESQARPLLLHAQHRPPEPVRRSTCARGSTGPSACSSTRTRSAADGTVALTATVAHPDGVAAWPTRLSRSGSDRQEIFVRDVATGKDLPDKLLWAKFTTITWTPDKEGFYYTRFPQPGTRARRATRTTSPRSTSTAGRAAGQGRARLRAPEQKERHLRARSLTRDGRFLVLTGYRGLERQERGLRRDRDAGTASPRSLFTGLRRRVDASSDDAGRAPLLPDGQGRAARPGGGGGPRPTARREPVEVLAGGQGQARGGRDREHADRGAAAPGTRAAASSVHGLDGRAIAAIELPALGIDRRPHRRARRRRDVPRLHVLHLPVDAVPLRLQDGRAWRRSRRRTRSRIDSAAYEVEQVWYPSKDGTKVSMFLVHKKGLARDGAPADPALRLRRVQRQPDAGLQLLAGFVLARARRRLALANLRGGGEYGEDWHQAGMLEKKQNVFDDFIAAAEWLIAERLHDAASGSPSRAAATAACSWARP